MHVLRGFWGCLRGRLSVQCPECSFGALAYPLLGGEGEDPCSSSCDKGKGRGMGWGTRKTERGSALSVLVTRGGEPGGRCALDYPLSSLPRVTIVATMPAAPRHRCLYKASKRAAISALSSAISVLVATLSLKAARMVSVMASAWAGQSRLGSRFWLHTGHQRCSSLLCLSTGGAKETHPAATRHPPRRGWGRGRAHATVTRGGEPGGRCALHEPLRCRSEECGRTRPTLYRVSLRSGVV